MIKQFIKQWQGKGRHHSEHLPVHDCSGQGSQLLQTSKEQAFTQFLNCLIAHAFDPDESQHQLQQAFYVATLEFSIVLKSLGHDDYTIELQSVQMAEEQRHKAKRRYHEIYALAESVLIDQRNHLLAQHINTRAARIGLQKDTPFSGLDTECGSPCNAFTYKLAADSALKRGVAAGLFNDSIEQLGNAIKTRAEADIHGFLALYYQERIAS